MAMMDGVANGVDRYHVPEDWQVAAELACNDPASLVNTVHSAEDDDADGTRWPRAKRHDDKAIVLVEFAPLPGPNRRPAPSSGRDQVRH